MNTLLRTFILFLLFPLSLMAQQGKMSMVEGRVTDEAAQPMSYVHVSIVGAGNDRIVLTDQYGKYQTTVARGERLRFSSMGMKAQEVVYDGQAIINIRMQDDVEMMRTVTVSAKTNINAIDLRARAGVLQEVDMRKLNDKPMIDMGLALQGAVPGLQVMNTGELGSAPTIRIRGNSSLRKGNTTNEPLYVLDGQVISPETFYNLNPTDIKDIKVLKDAAACALYGVKAANGVIEMTSQRGHAEGTTVSYNFNMGVTMRGRRGIRMMDTDEKLELERRLQNTETPGYRYSADYYNRYHANDPNLASLIAAGQVKLDSLRGINTDWFNELIRPNIYQKHNLSVKGGNEKMRYYLSANYTKQGGRIPGNDKERIGARLNIDRALGHIGSFMISVNGDVATTHTPVGTKNDPTQLVYDLNPYEQKTGVLYSNPGQTYNDLMNQYEAEASDKSFGGSANLTLDPLPGLNISAVAGIDYLIAEGTQFTPGNAYSETHSGVAANKRGIFSKNKNTTTNITSNLRVNYNKVWNERHDLTLGANMDYYQTRLDNVGITGYGVGLIKSAAAINQSIQGVRQASVSGLKDKMAQLGFGGVVGYTYDNTYDIYATYKADASSVLPSDKRWNAAWAVGAGWTPTSYAFLKDSKWLSELNLKASYGWMANLSGVSASSTVGTFMYATSAYEDQRPLQLITLYNADLKPEQTKSMDLSFTFGLFHRASFTVNLYDRRTEQALLDVPIPTSTGYSMLKRNIGILDNRGIELMADVKILNTPTWQLSMTANMAYNRNKVVDLYYADKIYSSDEALVPDYEVGKSYDMIYGPLSAGIHPFTGYPVFIVNGQEKQATQPLVAEDVVALGYSTPPYSGSFGLRAAYKQLELDIDFYYVHGGINSFNYTYVRNKDNANKNAVAGQVDKMWFKVGDEDKVFPTPFYTSATAEENIALYPNSLTVAKSDYLRLSQVALRYRFTHKFLQAHCPWIKYANCSLQASNLYTWTSYNEADPESGKLAGSVQPVVNFNLNLTF